MANVIMSKQFSRDLEVDGSIRQRAWDFLTKLMNNPAQPGLHIEPINGAVDSRVRTGRVSDNYRAVMFETAPDQYVLAAIKKHDEANSLAERVTLRVNPVSGVLEIEATPSAVAAPAARVAEAATPVAGPLSVFSLVELTDVVGLSPDIALAARAAADEDELLVVAGGAPAWQADALLSLATGRAPAEIAAELRAAADEAAVESATDPHEPLADAVERAYAHPASQMEFVKITDDEQLRRVVQGSFREWRVFLHPDQRRFAYRSSYSGPFRLSGGAGTGKTVVALHRAKHLAHDPRARIVLTTFTTTLADSLLEGLRELDPTLRPAARLGDPGIYVVGVDKLARDVLGALGEDAVQAAAPYLGSLRLTGDVALSDADDRRMWDEAVTAAGSDLAPAKRKAAFLSAEYRTVVLGKGITSELEYARVARTGRGVRLNRAERLAVWNVVETYRRGLAMLGKVSFSELTAVAASALAGAAPAGLVDHVVVDEAQDLHINHWRLLRALVPSGANDLFICEDSHQRIYGEKVVLGRLGIHVQGRSRRLTLNYRTTAQNLRFAVAVLSGAGVTDLDGEPEDTVAYRSPMRGPSPRLAGAISLTDELDSIAGTLRDWLAVPDVEPGSLAVLVRGTAVRDTVKRGLADRGITVHAVSGRSRRGVDVPQLLTMHRAKGLEFSRVVLAGVDERQLPATRVLADHADEDQQDAAQRERLLLYVASSRARDELVVTWHGAASPFLPVTTI